MIAFVISVLGVVIALASMNISQRLERIAKAIEDGGNDLTAGETAP